MTAVAGPAVEIVDALVLAAMPEELRPLRAMLASLRPVPGGGNLERGWTQGRALALMVTGDGPRNAQAGVAAALDRVHPRAVLGLGVAGALSPELAPGALLAGQQVMREAGEMWCGDPALLAAARRAGAQAGALVSASRIADTVADKQRLLAIASARAPGLLAAVDLESATFAAAASSRGLPWLILRAISDGANDVLPPLLNRSLDAGGAVRRGWLAAHLITQPSALPQLLGLRQRVRDCAERLAVAAIAVVAAA